MMLRDAISMDFCQRIEINVAIPGGFMNRSILFLAICFSWSVMGEPISLNAIAVTESGNPQGEALVLLHGNGSDSESFLPILSALEKTYHILRYDQRGQGKTDYDGVDFSIESMVDDLEMLLKSKSISKAHLLGHSFGSRIAVAFADRYPDQVDSLIIEDMDMLARQPAQPGACTKLAEAMRSLNRVYASQAELRQAIAVYYGPNPQPLDKFIVEQRAGGAIRLVKNPYAPYVWGCVANSTDLDLPLKNFARGVFILRADPSQTAIDPNWLRQFQATRPDAKLAEFPGSHHFIHLFDPARFSEAVLEFLKGI
jgi:pimeloyl-ACP methyl ester carboxylesterase